MSIAEIIKKNKAAGHHFFDSGTKRFFASRILPTVYGGRFFVTSENNFDGTARFYTVREAMPDGSIRTVGEFNRTSSKSKAVSEAKRLAKTAENPRQKRGITRKLARAALIVGSRRRGSKLKSKLRRHLGKKFRKSKRHGVGWVRKAALMPKRRR